MEHNTALCHRLLQHLKKDVRSFQSVVKGKNIVIDIGKIPNVF